jgi:hypothetical protein
LFYLSSVDTAAGRVAFLGLNSAWASAVHYDYPRQKAQDRENLFLGEQQIDTVLRQLAQTQARLRIALVHHPFQWLRDFDRNMVEHPLRQRCHMILHGHEHELSLAAQSTPDAEVILLGMAATFISGGYENRCGAVTLDMTSGQGEIELLRHSPQKGGGWVDDTLSYPALNSSRVPCRLRWT